MCVFCAAIPAALAVGVNAQVKHTRAHQEADQRDDETSRPKIEPKTATALVVAGLAVASIVYHTQAF